MNQEEIANPMEGNKDLLSHKCSTITADKLFIPSPAYIDQIFSQSNRNIQTIKNLSAIFQHGNLAGTGYLSILPVDQGVEHSAGASFAPSPIYFDPEMIIKLALEGNCNAVTTTLGGLAIVSRKYAHKIPFIAKINHNELLTYPNNYEQVMFGSVREA
jgi:fructose-bisphosphate aldolase, class I